MGLPEYCAKPVAGRAGTRIPVRETRLEIRDTRTAIERDDLYATARRFFERTDQHFAPAGVVDEVCCELCGHQSGTASIRGAETRLLRQLRGAATCFRHFAGLADPDGNHRLTSNA
jgi:hypothetical protein